MKETHLSNFQKLANAIHSRQELFVQIQSIAALLLVHVKVLLQQVDDGVVVAGK